MTVPIYRPVTDTFPRGALAEEPGDIISRSTTLNGG